MRMFAFDPSRYRQEFGEKGYVHIRGGLTEEFHADLARQSDEYLRSRRLADFALGDKEQGLYEFPEDGACYRELVEAVAAVCGFAAKDVVLSERHIKAYDGDASAAPLAHKDRLQSQVAVGLSITVPKGSTLVLYPHDHLDVNPFSSSAELRTSLAPDRLPEPYLRHARRVEIEDAPRDVVMFRGNAIWHHRIRPANTRILYLKLNAFHSDPLGEDPLTPGVRARTEAIVAADEAELLASVPRPGRRLDHIDRRFTHDGVETAGAVLWGQPRLALTEVEFRALRAMDGIRTVREVLAVLGDGDTSAVAVSIRRLASRGVVDLAPARPV